MKQTISGSLSGPSLTPL